MVGCNTGTQNGTVILANPLPCTVCSSGLCTGAASPRGVLRIVDAKIRVCKVDYEGWQEGFCLLRPLAKLTGILLKTMWGSQN